MAKLVPEAEPEGWQELVLAQMGESDKTSLGQAQVIAIRSTSDPMAVHYLFDLGWIVVCTCKGFRYRSDCRHARAYLDKREREGV